MKKKLLDLYCGAGLAAIGYKQAGFEVIGIDIERKSCYAGDLFIQGDALGVLKDIPFLRQFDTIHASPPCQHYSQSTAMFRKEGKIYADLIGVTRAGLDRSGLPYIIENVPRAPIRADIVLHGWMFGLNVMRARKFELSGWWMMQPGIPKRRGCVKDGDFCTIIGKQGYRKYKGLPKGWRPKFDQGSGLKTWHYAMGIPPEYNFKDVEISEGIPPAYTSYIGGYLMEFLNHKKQIV
ncbi:MAG TPA: DNA cytosine methyltransferase [bacterium]|nr:DNA cytosine methyltransferase [bacterium]